VSVPLAVASALALSGAAIHSIVGEILVVRKISVGNLKGSPFGGPRATMLMIRVTWHIVGVAFLVIGIALAACAASGGAGACVGVAQLASASFAGFLLVAIAVAGRSDPRMIFRHPAPLVFAAVALLAWVGAK
jgi:hypothetical protein